MKKSLFALAALATIGTCAQAQTSITLYGLVDAGVVVDRSCNGCNNPKLGSGVASGSRIGLRGNEDLGGGLGAIFVLETGMQIDTGRLDQSGGAGTLFGRQAFVGLNGGFGTVTLGRQYNLDYLTITEVADPFRGGMAGSASNLVGYSARRMDNTIQYASPTIGGFTGTVAYGFGETANDNSANRSYGGALGYANGPVTLRLAHENKNTTTAGSATVVSQSSNAKNTLLAGNVNLGVATVFAGYGVNKGAGSSPFWNADNPYGAAVPSTASTDSRDALLGVSVPFGATTLMASYIHKDDRNLANRDADQIGVGASYAVSKRTDFYAAYAHIKNRNGAAYTVGNATDAGTGCIAFNVGVRHSF
jgi:predicted porin